LRLREGHRLAEEEGSPDRARGRRRGLVDEDDFDAVDAEPLRNGSAQVGRDRQRADRDDQQHEERDGQPPGFQQGRP